MYIIQNAMHVKLVRFLSSMYQHEFSLKGDRGISVRRGQGNLLGGGRGMCWEGAGE